MDWLKKKKKNSHTEDFESYLKKLLSNRNEKNFFYSRLSKKLYFLRHYRSFKLFNKNGTFYFN